MGNALPCLYCHSAKIFLNSEQKYRKRIKFVVYYFFYFSNQSRDIFLDIIMQNEAGEYVDLYIPRKCSASNRIIAAKDHASIQLNIADVDEKTGRMTGTSKTYAICGTIRRMGESDDCLNRLAKKDGIIAKNF